MAIPSNAAAAVNTSYPSNSSDIDPAMYDETDHEVEALLAGVVKPSEDPITTFDNYNPRAAYLDPSQGGQGQGGLEGFMRGYQYQFASRGFPNGKRGVVPTLDDQGRLRLRRSQEAIWDDATASRFETSPDYRPNKDSASPLVHDMIGQVITPTHRSYRSFTEQDEDGHFGSRHPQADYRTDDSADYSDDTASTYSDRPGPTYETGRPPFPASNNMAQPFGASYRRPQPQRAPPTTSLFMDSASNPLFTRSHDSRLNRPAPPADLPSNSQRGPAPMGPGYYDEEDAYYDDLEYEEEYRNYDPRDPYRRGANPQYPQNPQYSNNPRQPHPPHYSNSTNPSTNSGLDPSQQFRQSHSGSVMVRQYNPQGQMVQTRPSRHNHAGYPNSNPRYGPEVPPPYQSHHGDPYDPRGPHQHPYAPADPREHYGHPADYDAPRHGPHHHAPPPNSEVGHHARPYANDPYARNPNPYPQQYPQPYPDQYDEYVYEYEAEPYDPPPVANRYVPPPNRPSHRHSPVRIYTRQGQAQGQSEETIHQPYIKGTGKGDYPILNQNQMQHQSQGRRQQPLPYSDQLPDYLNAAEDYEPPPPSVRIPNPSGSMPHSYAPRYPNNQPSGQTLSHQHPRHQNQMPPQHPNQNPNQKNPLPNHAAPPPNPSNLPPNLVPPNNNNPSNNNNSEAAQKSFHGSQKSSGPQSQTTRDNRTPSPIPDKMQLALKAKLQLSPATKAAFKDFFREYKATEREGFEAAKLFAAQHFQLLPEKVHWKIFLEVADLAKRENRFKEASKYYEKVNLIQPFAAKGWLEYAKMMEECGDLEECTRILTDGLYFCPQNESLLVKGIKHAERIGNIGMCRVLLARLKNVSMDRSWRTVMEGGLLEARQGNIGMARQIFKYLFEHVPLYGPVYIEAVQMEIKRGAFDRALLVVDLGLERCPTYGPLWLLAIQVDEQLGMDFEKRLNDSLPYLSKELVWKMYFESAQFYEARRDEERANDAYVKAVLTCPTNVLLWRIWSGGARTAVHFNRPSVARQLLLRAYSVVPSKMKPSVLIDSARFEEFLGEAAEARRILKKAKRENPNDWKAFLESVLIEMRSSAFETALLQVKEALETHSSTGRLWAMFVCLSHLVAMDRSHRIPYNEELQTAVFVEALANVPKSGEVWCEGARLAMRARLFVQARRFLEFAIQFTPQYGDSFIELLRLEFLERISANNSLTDLSTLTTEVFAEVERVCVNSEPSYGVSWSFSRQSLLDNPRQTLHHARSKFERLCLERVKRFGPRPTSDSASSSDPTPSATFEIPITKEDDFVLLDLDLLASFLGKGEDYFDHRDKEVRFRSIFI